MTASKKQLKPTLPARSVQLAHCVRPIYSHWSRRRWSWGVVRSSDSGNNPSAMQSFGSSSHMYLDNVIYIHLSHLWMSEKAKSLILLQPIWHHGPAYFAILHICLCVCGGCSTVCELCRWTKSISCIGEERMKSKMLQLYVSASDWKIHCASRLTFCVCIPVYIVPACVAGNRILSHTPCKNKLKDKSKVWGSNFNPIHPIFTSAPHAFREH